MSEARGYLGSGLTIFRSIWEFLSVVIRLPRGARGLGPSWPQAPSANRYAPAPAPAVARGAGGGPAGWQLRRRPTATRTCGRRRRRAPGWPRREPWVAPTAPPRARGGRVAGPRCPCSSSTLPVCRSSRRSFMMFLRGRFAPADPAVLVGRWRFLRPGLASVLLPQGVREPPLSGADPHVTVAGQGGEHLLSPGHAKGGLQGGSGGGDLPVALQRLKEFLLLAYPARQGGRSNRRNLQNWGISSPRGTSKPPRGEEEHHQGNQGEEREDGVRRCQCRKHEEQQQPKPY